jgi:hypothetical protein
MKKNLLTLAKCLQLASLPVLVLAICIPDTGAAQAVHQVAGTWKITVSGSYEFELQLRQSGQDIEGTMRRTNGTEPIDAVSGTVGTDGSIKFTRTRAPNEWRQTYTGKIKAQGGTLHMNGDWAHDGKPVGTWNAEQTGRITLVGAGGRQSTVSAIIDRNCIPRGALFTVPAGQTATSFKFAGLSSGTHCTTGGRVPNPAWGISSGGDTRTGNVFYYNQNDNGTVYELINKMPGRLADLVLGPGQYWVHVDGGIGAHVLLTFDLVAAIPGGGGVAGGGVVGGQPIPSVESGGASTHRFADGELIRQSGTQAIYVIEKGIRRLIPDPETFNARGYSWGAVKDISSEEIRSVPEGQPIPSVKSGGASTHRFADGELIRQSGTQAIYVTEKGIRRLIPDPETLVLQTSPWVDATGQAAGTRL